MTIHQTIGSVQLVLADQRFRITDFVQACIVLPADLFQFLTFQVLKG